MSSQQLKSRAKRIEDLPLLLTVEEFAAAVGLGRQAAYGMVRANQVRSVKLGRSIRIPRTVLERLLAGEASAPAPSGDEAPSRPPLRLASGG